MQAWIFVILVAAHEVALSASYYHVLVSDDRKQLDGSLNTFSSHLRSRRSLMQPDELLATLLEDEEGSGTDGEELGRIQEFQFFVKNTDLLNPARTTISEVMPGNAVLMDFSIHNEGKTYTYNKHETKTVEEAGVEFQNSISNGLSAVMLGDVKSILDRCSDCRTEASDPSEAVAAVVNIAPGDILSVSLSYMVPKDSTRMIDSEKEIYRTDTTIDLDESAKNLTGILMSPNYPENYPNDADITWLLNAPNLDMVIAADVMSFETEACCDYLYIYDGSTDTHPLISVISGYVSSPETIVTTRSSMLLKFKTDALVTGGGFSVQFYPTTRHFIDDGTTDNDKDGANGTVVLQDGYGIIKTPQYPEFYAADATLVWDVWVESGYAIDIQILDFDVFDGETLQIRNLDTDEDYFTFDSTSILETPYSFSASANHLSVIFRSNEKIIPKRGLYAKYYSRIANEINLLSVDTEWHTISSPHYPHHYSNNEHLVWIVTLEDETSEVRIEVVSLNLENGYDFLALYSGTSIDDSKRLAVLSGTNGDGVEYLSRENSATIVFQSDRSITDTGFQLRFRNFMEYTNCSVDTKVIYGGPSGRLRNPDYPNYTGIFHDCRWLITVKEAKVITAFLESFRDIDATLTFYDGASKNDPVLWTGGGNTEIVFDNAITVLSTSNQLYVVMSRTPTTRTTKYAFRFQEIDIDAAPDCPPLTANMIAPGQIKSPKYPVYAPHGDCDWLIQAPTGYQVLLTFIYYYISNSYSSLRIYDGNSTSNLITDCRYCTDGYSVRSASDAILIETSVASNAYFKLEYEFVSGSTSLMNREIGSAMSPSFPDQYPDNSYEVIYIEVASGSVMFYFAIFDTEACCDTLHIFDGDSTSSTLIASLSGNQQGFEGHTSGRYLTLEFSSDGSVPGTGFKMEYCSSTQDCGFLGIHDSAYSYLRIPYTDYSYVIASPSASGLYPSNTDFYWYIECPSVDTYRIRYELERVDVDNTDSFAVYNGFAKDDSNEAANYPVGLLDYYNGRYFYGYVSRNLIWFHSDTSFNGMGFYLSYYCDKQ